MSTEYAEYLLQQWGKWCLSGRIDLGYPHHTAFLNGQPQTGGSSLLIRDETAMQVQRAVTSLDREHRRAAEYIYVKMRSARMEDIARYLRCTDRTLRRRAEQVRIKVMQVCD